MGFLDYAIIGAAALWLGAVIAGRLFRKKRGGGRGCFPGCSRGCSGCGRRG